jgi:hypothetical protein
VNWLKRNQCQLLLAVWRHLLNLQGYNFIHPHDRSQSVVYELTGSDTLAHRMQRLQANVGGPSNESDRNVDSGGGISPHESYCTMARSVWSRLWNRDAPEASCLSYFLRLCHLFWWVDLMSDSSGPINARVYWHHLCCAVLFQFCVSVVQLKYFCHVLQGECFANHCIRI